MVFNIEGETSGRRLFMKQEVGGQFNPMGKSRIQVKTLYIVEKPISNFTDLLYRLFSIYQFTKLKIKLFQISNDRWVYYKEISESLSMINW
jgi:hypothetical protein